MRNNASNEHCKSYNDSVSPRAVCKQLFAILHPSCSGANQLRLRGLLVRRGVAQADRRRARTSLMHDKEDQARDSHRECRLPAPATPASALRLVGNAP